LLCLTDQITFIVEPTKLAPHTGANTLFYIKLTVSV